MNDNKHQAGSGLSFGSVLLVVFIVLKLTGNVGWSWWWVLSPLWVGFGVLLAIGTLVYGTYAISSVVSTFRWNRRLAKAAKLLQQK